MKPAAWTIRKFSFDRPLATFPEVLERLRGTPGRAGELVSGLPEEILGARLEGKWSAKEHLGHLTDLVALEEKRLQEFLSGAAALSAADMSNEATEAAGHNQAPIAAILAKLRRHRLQWLTELEALTESEIARTALHPRLQQPMRVIDWAYFIAEHDDHHLAAARYVLARIGQK
jgi:hypothetical protein